MRRRSYNRPPRLSLLQQAAGSLMRKLGGTISDKQPNLLQHSQILPGRLFNLGELPI